LFAKQKAYRIVQKHLEVYNNKSQTSQQEPDIYNDTTTRAKHLVWSNKKNHCINNQLVFMARKSILGCQHKAPQNSVVVASASLESRKVPTQQSIIATDDKEASNYSNSYEGKGNQRKSNYSTRPIQRGICLLASAICSRRSNNYNSKTSRSHYYNHYVRSNNTTVRPQEATTETTRE
jgi:hypothetical protein